DVSRSCMSAATCAICTTRGRTKNVLARSIYQKKTCADVRAAYNKDMKTETKFEYAVLGPGESLCSPDTCDCCGRDGLKKTVKLVHPSGNAVWYGVGCAAKAMSLKNGEVERARKAQISDLEDSERKSRAVAFHAEQAEWVAFLI